MSIGLQIHSITDTVQMAHDTISCGGTGKHGYTLESIDLNESYEETSGDCNGSMHTFPCTGFGIMCARVGRIPGFPAGTNRAPVNRQEFPSRLNDYLVRR